MRVPVFFAMTVALSAVAIAAPRGTVVLRNGTRFEGVEYEVKGKSVRVTLKFGERDFPMSEIKQLIPDSDADALEEEEDESGARASDWKTRFRVLSRDGWQPIVAKTPLVRARIKHEEKDATVSVSVRPARDVWVDPGALGKKVKLPKELPARFHGEMLASFAMAGKPSVVPASFQGTTVYRIESTVMGYRDVGKRPTRHLTQLRFRRHGLEYAVTYEAKLEDHDSLQHEVADLLGAFTFLPGMTVSEDVFADYHHGFRIERANNEWEIKASPFDEERPLMITTADGRGEVRVEVHSAGGAQAHVGAYIAGRKKASRGHFTERSQEEEVRDGLPVVQFAFEDFRQGGRKKLLFQGFAVSLGDKVLRFVGLSPLSDEDARKIELEVAKTLRSVTVRDAVSLEAELGRERDALGYLREAMGRKKSAAERIQRYDDAIAAKPDFALAYYLRGRAKKEQGRVKEYAADLEEAEKLAPGAGYADELGNLARTEAVVASQRKDWKRAVGLWRRVCSSSKSEEDFKQLSTAVSNRWNQIKRDKTGDTFAGIEELDENLASMKKDRHVHPLLAKVYKEGCLALLKRKQSREAKKVARKLKGLGRAAKVSRYTTDAKALEARVKRGK